MSHGERLSGLDASFLHLEDGGAHMHVGACLVFEGTSPGYDELLAHLEARLPLVPRYRRRLAGPPVPGARPVLVEDPRFQLGYHARHTALPPPAGLDQLRGLTGRILGQRLDRGKPLWEAWLVERVRLPDGAERFALITKTHHALVDGVAALDLASVLLDRERAPAAERGDVPAWAPGPVPTRAALLADAAAAGAGAAASAARGLTGALARPERAVSIAAGTVAALGAFVRAGAERAPESPLNVPTGPHRRVAWVDADLARFQAIKDALGGTVNDAVLAVVAGALRTHWRAHGLPTAGVTLRALVPVSMRAADELGGAPGQLGGLGNRIAPVAAPLPLHPADPVERHRTIVAATAGLRTSGQAVGAEVLTHLADFAPPTVLAQASRLQARQRLFNLAVTNVPGPQEPLYLLGRRLEALHPHVPLARDTALGVAVVSYAGRMGFGLLADQDALPDLDALADALAEAVEELAGAAGAPGTRPRRNGRAPGARREAPLPP